MKTTPPSRAEIQRELDRLNCDTAMTDDKETDGFIYGSLRALAWVLGQNWAGRPTADPKVKRVRAWRICHTHRKYEAKLPPRVPCEECWRLYFRKDKERLDGTQ